MTNTGTTGTSVQTNGWDSTPTVFYSHPTQYVKPCLHFMKGQGGLGTAWVTNVVV